MVLPAVLNGLCFSMLKSECAAFLYISLFFKLFIQFNWRTIASQHCGSFPRHQHEPATGAPVLRTLSPAASHPPHPSGSSRAPALGAPLHATSLHGSSILFYGQGLFIYGHDEDDKRLHGQILGWSGSAICVSVEPTGNEKA